jgi:hypothetical protein
MHCDTYFEFKVGRFARSQRDWDTQTLPTPLASFLRSKAWVVVYTQHGQSFRRVNQCWVSQGHKGVASTPRFLGRPSEIFTELLADEDLAKLMFGKALGLRNWHSDEMAIDRLKALESVVPLLQTKDRLTFRSAYLHTWDMIVDSVTALPSNGLNLVVSQRNVLKVIEGSCEAPASIIVIEKTPQFETGVLTASDQAVLEVGEGTAKKVEKLLKSSGVFLPCLLDGAEVQVDNERFEPSSQDPLLISLGLEWLPDVLMIGHELKAQQLELGIDSSIIKKRICSIRVRYCESISLILGNKSISGQNDLEFFVFEHAELPTLILANQNQMTWGVLGRTISSPLSRLIDSRIRYLEPLLLRLALESPNQEIFPPTNEALADALKCDVSEIKEQRHALRSSLEHILAMLKPLVAYYGDADLAKAFDTDCKNEGSEFDPAKWLQQSLDGLAVPAQQLINACEQASDYAEVRRALGLDYGKYNRVLLELGESPLSNESSLYRQYQAHLCHMEPRILVQLRHFFLEDFLAGKDLTTYVQYKSLEFLPFNKDWILIKEGLNGDEVEAHVNRLLNEIFGEEPENKLQPLAKVQETNRKNLRKFAKEALPLVRGWCDQNHVTVPSAWTSKEPQSLIINFENRGFFDFEVITMKQIPAYCRRIHAWPADMEETLSLDKLGLTRGFIEKRKRQQEHDKHQKIIKDRSVEFAGNSLDTGDSSFPEHFQQLAEQWLQNDDTWFNRSKSKTVLSVFEAPDNRPQRHSNFVGRNSTTHERRLPDVVRGAMGLASEWLAYHFLKQRHSDYMSESSWVSKNRANFFGGEPGDDSVGFDFKVKTPKVEWLYEVKSTLEDSGEFELTANELRVASSTGKEGSRRYRILYVPYVFSPDKWHVLELPNPMGEKTRDQFLTIDKGSVRLRFKRK